MIELHVGTMGSVNKSEKKNLKGGIARGIRSRQRNE